MSANRMPIDDQMLEAVAGGNLRYVWDDASQVGYIWINDDTAAYQTKYKFTDKTSLLAAIDKDHLKYGDYGMIDKLAEATLINKNDFIVNNYNG